MICLITDKSLHGLEAPPLIWHVEDLKHMRERSVVATDTLDGSLQVEEALLLFDNEKKEKWKKM